MPLRVLHMLTSFADSHYKCLGCQVLMCCTLKALDTTISSATGYKNRQGLAWQEYFLFIASFTMKGLLPNCQACS